MNKIKLNLSKIKNRQAKQEAKEQVADYLEDTILDYLSQGISPVTGKPFIGLSKNYKKIKAKISGSTKPNMELHGDMLDDFEVRIKGNEVSFGFHTDAHDKSKLKAENHNKFTVRSRKTKLPERRFIPYKDQKLHKDIMQDIAEIINDLSEDDAD